MDRSFKYSEESSLLELKDYIESTYSAHYAQGQKLQAIECIAEAGHREGFCVGNIIKYAMRYGKKKGRNREYLLKIMHYALILLDKQEGKEESVS